MVVVVVPVDVVGAVDDGLVGLAVLVGGALVSLPTGGGALLEAVPQAPSTSVIAVRRLAQPIDRAPRAVELAQLLDVE